MYWSRSRWAGSAQQWDKCGLQSLTHLASHFLHVTAGKWTSVSLRISLHGPDHCRVGVVLEIGHEVHCIQSLARCHFLVATNHSCTLSAPLCLCTHKAGALWDSPYFSSAFILLHMQLFSTFHKQVPHTIVWSYQHNFAFLNLLIANQQSLISSLRTLMLWCRFLSSWCVCFIFQEKYQQLCLHIF